MNYEIAVLNIRKELKAYIQQNNIKSLVLGVSGGMDSCLCAALAKPVCNDIEIPLIGRSLPIITNEQDEINRANLTGITFCNDYTEDRILEVYYERMASELNAAKSATFDLKSWKIRNGNIKARLRMIYLYNLASMNNGMILSTDNYTEYMLGFWTLHGDVGDYGMIQELWKTEVYNMAEWLADNEYPQNYDASNALKSTIYATATDGLGVTNIGDLGQILPEWTGTSRDGYKEVDSILLNFLENKELDEKNPVIQRHLRSQFKRNNPTNIPRNLIIK